MYLLFLNTFNKHKNPRLDNITRITKTKINVLDTAFGLPENSTDYNLGVVPLQGKSYIEVDAYPKEAIKRPKLEGYLPPGNSIMSLLINSIDYLLLYE